jgi:flagellar protein FliO/FliZ
MQTPYTFFFAFIAVLALIGLTAWLVRKFAGNRLGSNAARGRMPRLAVIDAAAVDGRRRLVLVRRDNVEHLLMIGGPTDIVVEPNIIRANAGREAARGNVGNELSARSAPLPEAPSWADNDSTPDIEPTIPEPAPRPNRPSFVEEPRRPLSPLPERRPEPVASVLPDLPARPEPRVEPRSEPAPRVLPRSEQPASRSETPMPRGDSMLPRGESMMPRPMRAEPPIRVAPPLRAERTTERSTERVTERAAVPVAAVTPPAPSPAAEAASSADQNLADMAQRLEAALRRPGEARAEPSEPRVSAPPVAPEPRPMPRFSSEVSIAPAARSESAAPAVAPPVKTGFENLEDEMASLLGRPKSSS